MDELASLIARLEAASEGSRELDRPIADLMGTVRPAHEEVDFESRSVTHWPDMFPAYTTSLDAALTLAPNGWSVSVSRSEKATFANAVLGRSYPTNAKVVIDASTPALALCIAALKARSHTAPQEK